MEVGMTWLASPTSFPSKTHLKNCLPSSVLMFQEQALHLVNCNPMREEYRPLLNTSQEDGTSKETLDRKQMEMVTSLYKEKDTDESDQFARKFKRRLFYWPLEHVRLRPSQTQENGSSYRAVQSSNASKLSDVEPAIVINLAKKALSASKEATLITKNSTDIDLVSSGSSSNVAVDEENIVVRSTRRLERQSKTRRVPKTIDKFPKPHNSKRVDGRKKLSEGYDSNNPLRSFLWGPETIQLLTPDEESKLIVQLQDLKNLEGVKCKLQSSFGREPTIVEWAQAAGLSCPVLREQVHSGNRGRQKLITANLRLVVHIAKQYEGPGLSLADLLQAGSMGLMKSVEKFKSEFGCRFATYAYWWIRHGVQKAVRDSNIIRLPECVYYQLSQIKQAKKSYIQEGNYEPTTEELARRTGISVRRVEKLLFMGRTLILVRNAAWVGQDYAFQFIADTEIENPEVTVAKQMMRQHVRELLNTLKPRERQIMILRFGFEDGKPKALSEIGDMFGLSKQYVWKLEGSAMHKLRQCIDSHGLEAYVNLLA
nr:plastidic RNA polymerase sigma-subunit 6 [Passiflora contracta]